MCFSVMIVHTTVQPMVPSQMPIHSVSNFLTSTQCGCQSPLICDHGQQFAVKLSDFDSALEVTKVQTRHSVLRQLYRNNPTGTPGYRPPEVWLVACVHVHVCECVHERLDIHIIYILMYVAYIYSTAIAQP